MIGLCRGRPAAAVLCLLVAACGLAAPAGAEAPPNAPAEPPPNRPEPTAKDLRTTDKVRAADAKRDGYKSPTGVAFSRDGQTAYVTCHTADTLAVIDAAAGKKVAEVPVGRAPTGVAVAPDGKTVYVAGTLLVGWWSKRQAADAGGYLLGGRLRWRRPVGRTQRAASLRQERTLR